MNRARCCALFGWTRVEFDALVVKGMPVISTPSDKGGSYQVASAQVAEWLASRGNGESAVLDLNDERARLAHEQANMAELKRRKMQGDLLDGDDVIEAWQDAVARFRTLMLGLPATCAEECIIRSRDGEKAVREFLKSRVHLALAELSRIEMVGEDEDEEADLAA
ncbi:MAG: hypothetical protein KDG54_15815 [Geminicoccaceae bacterium]|nr:hypothetical protein [Geminicoccaceae bacterium]